MNLSIFKKNVEEKPVPSCDEDLKTLIDEAYSDLSALRKNLQYATDPTLIDMYSHSLLSAQMRCKYLLQMAKKEAK